MLPNYREPPHHTRCYEGRAHITKQDVTLANHTVKSYPIIYIPKKA